MQAYTFQFNREELKHALSSGQVQHYYQSVVHMKTLDALSFETLVRWNHPTLGLLTANRFVFELAREGLLPTLTGMAVRHAATFYHSAIAQGLEPVPVSINVTAAEIEAPEWRTDLLALTQELALPPANLMIEVLEWGKAQDIEKVGQVALKLKETGHAIIADDFGEAFGTFYRLLAIPFNGIKVGYEFTKALNINPQAKVILECLVDLTRKLDMGLVVEGVETESEASALLALGITKAQGFLYHQPSPIAGALQQLRSKKSAFRS